MMLWVDGDPTQLIVPTPPIEVTYKLVNDQPLRADLYLPENPQDRVPAVVFVHGGVWTFGGRKDYRDFGRWMAQQGIAAFCIDMRVPTEDGFDEPISDIKDSVRWLRSNAADYGIDPERIGIFGSSSGAHLASLVAFCGDGEGLGDDPPGQSSRVDACFLLYGLYDLETPFRESLPWAPAIGYFMGGSPDERGNAYDLYSPLTHIDGSEPPSLVMHGDTDILAPVSEAAALVERLKEAGVQATFVEVDGLGHGFARIRRWLRPAVFQSVLDFFEETL